jgi:hypothetical protein
MLVKHEYATTGMATVSTYVSDQKWAVSSLYLDELYSRSPTH